MTGLCGRSRSRPWRSLALAALLASCQPLPHPFADDRPPAELLAVPESAGVSIAPVEGQPGAIAAKLGAATARALLGARYSGQRKDHRPRQLSAVWPAHSIGARRQIGCRGPVAAGGCKRTPNRRARGRDRGYGRRLAISGWRDDRARGRAERRRRGAAACQGIRPPAKFAALSDAGLQPGGAGRAAGVVPGETARPGTPPCKSRAPGPRLGEAGSPDATCGRDARRANRKADGSGWPCAA